MDKPRQWADYAELATLFFIQWLAMGMWFVPLTNVLDAHGLSGIRPYAFATSAIAAFVSPLIFGAMADRGGSPVRVLRGLAIASSLVMVAASWSIQHHWPAYAVLLLIQIQMLCSTPVTSISTSIVFSRLFNPRTEFGPIRAIGTFGWMCGCWVVSAIGADASTLSGYSGAAGWMLLAGFTYLLPNVAPPRSSGPLTLKERMGWDALVLLKNRDHRMVFITAALYNTALAVFFPYTPPQLREFGMTSMSAWMSIGQISEIVAMLTLGRLFLRIRLKWIFVAGLAFGVVRYGLCAFNSKGWVIAGIALHGFSYTLYFITAQIYLEQRIDPAWRTRAQALFYFMISGVGNLVGYLGGGVWFNACASAKGENWFVFWMGVTCYVAVVLTCFLIFYRGLGPMKSRKPADVPSAA